MWWVGACAECGGKCSKPSPDTVWGELAGGEGAFPGKSEIGNEAAGEA